MDADDIDPTGHLLAMLDNPHLAREIAALGGGDEDGADTDLYEPHPWDDDEGDE